MHRAQGANVAGRDVPDPSFLDPVSEGRHIMRCSWKDMRVIDTNVQSPLSASLEAGQGVLALLPAWVHREFCSPGRNLRLHPDDWFLLGPRKGIDERWFASTKAAQNTFKVDHEGLSFVRSPGGNRFLLSHAVQESGAEIIGESMWNTYREWFVYSKFFDNLYALPHHSHQREKHAVRAGTRGKPESYYFPTWYNQFTSAEPITFMGLKPGTKKYQVRQCLEAWGSDGSDIRYLSQGHLTRPGTGWLMPAGMLHAPAARCTFEPQAWSDTFQMYQPRTTDGWLDRDVLLFKDLPPDVAEAPLDRKIDYMVELLDWGLNVDPLFSCQHFLVPIRDDMRSGDGYERHWVVYGKINGQELFSAAETVIQPGCRLTLADKGASGVLFMNGHGKIGGCVVDTPSMLRYDEVSYDEFFVTAPVCKSTVVENTGETPLAMLQYYGPDTWGAELPAVAA